MIFARIKFNSIWINEPQNYLNEMKEIPKDLKEMAENLGLILDKYKIFKFIGN